MTTPIVWTIAGSDSSGCSGIQADLKTFNNLGLHGCSVITAITAQHDSELTSIEFLTPLMIQEQLNCLQKKMSPHAIKIGMLGSFDLSSFLSCYTYPVVLDPLFISTSGKPLFRGENTDHIQHLQKLFPFISLITPNIPEAEKLTGQSIHSYQDIEKAASQLIASGVKNVLIKGGHWDSLFSQDYWTNGHEHGWFANTRYHKNVRGTGCTLSSAITAFLAQGHSMPDAITRAKMYVNQSIKESTHPWLNHRIAANQQIDLPYVYSNPLLREADVFPDCGPTLGLYPVVPHSQWLECLLPLGISTIQLRIKDKKGSALKDEIEKSVALAQRYNARLFINDFWELAIQHKAYGVHLGQEDLIHADIAAIRQAGLRLGISTHSYYELAKAHAYKPSYIALGPIFATKSKALEVPPQGIEKLSQWQKMLSYPLVAIGGINDNNILSVINTNVSGIALISGITEAKDPIMATKQLLKKIVQK